MRIAALALILALRAAPDEGDRVLFTFDKDEEAGAWSNLDWGKEPKAEVSLSDRNPSSGKRSLKITFAGGRWPSVRTASVPEDWTPWKTFACEVAVDRDCMVGFQAVQEKSRRDDSWEGSISRWAKTVMLKAGRTEVRASLEDPSQNGYGINPARYGKITALEIFFYRPRAGETLQVENLRLLRAKVPGPSKPSAGVKVLGTDLVVGSVQELGKKLKAQWTKPSPRSVDEIESEFATEFGKLRAQHPRAVMACFRDGEKGYAGWRDAHINSHGPDTNTLGREKNTGSSPTEEAFMRHRSLILKADLSAIPPGSTIHAARFILVAQDSKFEKGRDPRVDPSMWVAEACNRPWVESEVNAYEYAKDKFWKSPGGMDRTDDPDFLPIYLAHGPGNAPVSTWDFTEAVRFWTDGKHENHGFMLHGDSYHYMGRACTRENPDPKSRPAILVAYEPRP
jgi:hypothetical protein